MHASRDAPHRARDRAPALLEIAARYAAEGRPDLAVPVAIGAGNADTSAAARRATHAAMRQIAAAHAEYLPAHYQVGRFSAITGEHLDEGLRALLRYLEQPTRPGDPSHAAAHWRIGMIHEHKGDRQQAREHMEKALELDPNMTEARQALERLR